MDFESWLLKTILAENLVSTKQLERANEFQQQYQSQGKSVPLSVILVKCLFLEDRQLAELKQRYRGKATLQGTEILSPSSGEEYRDSIVPASSIDKTLPQHQPSALQHQSSAPEPSIEEDLLRATTAAEIPKNFGRYKVLRMLGEGNVGQVFLVHDPKLDREVALKVLVAKENSDVAHIERFRREAKSIAKLRHPNIAGAYDIGEDRGLCFFTMDYVKGQSLGEILDKSRRMPARKALTILLKVAKALHYAHQNGIVHRDIKPANIMVDESGEPKLMDFGLARDMRGGNRVSKTGTIAGSPAYMAPEQAQGKTKEIDARTDVYGLGATMYELLTGTPVFAGQGVLQTLNKVVNDPPIPPREVNPAVPDKVQEICLKALEKKPENRYRSAAQMARDMEKFLAQRRGDPSAKVRETVRRLPFFSVLGAVIAIPLVVIAILSLWQGDDQKLLAQIDKLREKNVEQEGQLEEARIALLKVEHENKGKFYKLEQRAEKAEEQVLQLQQQATEQNWQHKYQQLLEQHEKLQQQLAHVKTQHILQDEPRREVPEEEGNKQRLAMFRGGADNAGVYLARGITDGKLHWRFQAKKGLFSSPAIVDGVIFIGSDDGHLYAINISDNQVKWKFRAGNAIGTSPAVVDGVVYFGSADTYFYAVSASDGSRKWSYKTDGQVVSSPVVQEKSVYFAGIDGHFYALDATTGKLQWKYNVGKPAWSSPAIADGVAFFGCHDGRLYALDLKTRKPRWSFPTQKPISASPAVADGVVYFGSGDGNFYAVSASDGKPQWKFSTRATIASSPAVTDNAVYFGSNDGNIYCVYRSNGLFKWKLQTKGKVFSSPAIADDTVYIGSFDGYLYALRATNGAKIWRYKTGPIISAPVASGGNVYVGSYTGYLYAISN